MTEDMMNLRTLVEKTPNADLLREMISFAAEKLMEMEVGAATGAAYGEKSPLRIAQRNGLSYDLGFLATREPLPGGASRRVFPRSRRPPNSLNHGSMARRIYQY